MAKGTGREAAELPPTRRFFGALVTPKTLSWVGLSGRAGKAAHKYLGL